MATTLYPFGPLVKSNDGATNVYPFATWFDNAGGASGAIAGTSSGSATASGTLSAQGALAGTAAGAATGAGDLGGAGALAGAAAGQGAATGTLGGIGALAGSSEAGAGGALVTDSYTDTNGTLLTAHTPEQGGGISAHADTDVSDAEINNGRAHGVSTGHTKLLYDVSPGQDFEAQFDVVVLSVTNSRQAGILFRHSSTVDEGYAVIYHRLNGFWYVIRINDGVANDIIGSWAETLGASDVRTCRLVTSVSSIKVYIDGTLRIDITDSTYNHGGFGLWWYNTATQSSADGLHLDNLSVGTGGAVSGTLTGTGALAGQADGAATVQGTLTGVGSGAMQGTAAGVATATGTMGGAATLSGTAAGVASVTATIQGIRFGSGQAGGAATVGGTITGNGALAGQADGVATAAGLLLAEGALVGIAIGVAVATGRLTQFGVTTPTAYPGMQLSGSTLPILTGAGFPPLSGGQHPTLRARP